MRKPLATRIFALAVLYCAVFCVLVILQFSSKRNFALSAGAMTIRGSYLQTPSQEGILSAEENSPVAEWEEITGGIKLFFGGLEFSMREDRGKGMTLRGSGGLAAVNPAFMFITDNTAHFALPGGTTVAFSSSDSERGTELYIGAEFAEDVSEIAIPVAPHRASVIRDNGHLGILYNGARYFFSSSGHELESGNLILSRENEFVSYRPRGEKRVFDPADYVIAQAQNYESAVDNWRESSYLWWSQNASSIQNENDAAAYMGEALRRGSYSSAAASISRSFLSGPNHGFMSAGFLGGITGVYRGFIQAEREKLNLVTNLTRERSLNVLKEERVLDYLFARGNTALADDIIDLIRSTGADALIHDYCPGLLEVYSDLKIWRPSASSPVEHLTSQILNLVSENLNRDAEKNLVFASGGNPEFSMRLGKALVNWAESERNSEWAAIGRSLVLSALTSSGPGSGKLYSILRPGEYYPKAAWLAENGLWAWTVSPSARASYVNGGDLNVSFTFPTGSSHYIIIRGVRPFIKVQLHDTDWRSDSQFESYDSSGWVYYSQDQALVLKLRHRSSVETVRIIYREPPPAAVESDADADANAAGEN
jgi:hypothetical protein